MGVRVAFVAGILSFVGGVLLLIFSVSSVASVKTTMSCAGVVLSGAGETAFTFLFVSVFF